MCTFGPGHVSVSEHMNVVGALQTAVREENQSAVKWAGVAGTMEKERDAFKAGVGQWQNACKQMEKESHRVVGTWQKAFNQLEKENMKLKETLAVCEQKHATNLITIREHQDAWTKHADGLKAEIASLKEQLRAKTAFSESIAALPMPRNVS